MAGQHHDHTKEFGELTFAEQANSITESINDLLAAIEHHIEQPARRTETMKLWLEQLDQVRERLQAASAGTNGPTIRVHIWSPRLVDPSRAADFLMEVAEGSEDAGL